MVVEGLNGFIVDPNNIDMLTDRVSQLIINRELRIKMGNSGRNLYEKKYTIDSFNNRLKEALRFFIELKEKT